jgi:outer membrane protein assembly factor BamB
LIAYQPVIEDDRVFTVRIKYFGDSEDPEDSPIVALDLNTGEELWFAHLPNNLGDWTTWIAGVRNGLVFSSRSGNGATVAAKLYALDAVTGGIVWESEDMVTAGPYDGVVFAPDGDPIIGSFTDLMRIDAATGDTVWDSPRVCSVSGNCGAAINGNNVYVADFAGVGGGHVIVRFDLETGARQYQSPVMGVGAMLLQNSPMAGPDGSVYLSRTSGNPANDYFFAFSDTGTGFVEKWNLAAEWTTSSEFGIGLDGSVYMVVPGDELVRLDSATGAVTATSGPLADFNSPRIAIDGAGNVYLSNRAFSSGRIYVFTADLTPVWDSAVTNINIGGPALGRNGTLVVCGNGTIGRAYRIPDAPAACHLFSDGFETGDTSAWSNPIW